MNSCRVIFNLLLIFSKKYYIHKNFLMLKQFSLFLLFSLILSACGTKKRMVYFQGDDYIESVKASYAPVFKKDDYLSVIVTADQPESALLFNFPQNIAGGNQRQMMGGVQMQLGPPVTNGYLVDEDGFIDLPVIGRTKVAGLSRKELKDKLVEDYEEYLDNPIVNIKILNFRIAVLGDVRNPGVKLIPNERITIPEVIALAGDLNPTAVRDNVMIIRERDGVRSEFRVDFTGRDVLSSEVYYLEQNDIVYVEPNLAGRSQGTFWRTTLPTILSLIGVGLTTLILITN